eukprot:1161853-Pelagomonas_calceolata.AAC.1
MPPSHRPIPIVQNWRAWAESVTQVAGAMGQPCIHSFPAYCVAVLRGAGGLSRAGSGSQDPATHPLDVFLSFLSVALQTGGVWGSHLGTYGGGVVQRAALVEHEAKVKVQPHIPTFTICCLQSSERRAASAEQEAEAKIQALEAECGRQASEMQVGTRACVCMCVYAPAKMSVCAHLKNDDNAYGIHQAVSVERLACRHRACMKEAVYKEHCCQSALSLSFSESIQLGSQTLCLRGPRLCGACFMEDSLMGGSFHRCASLACTFERDEGPLSVWGQMQKFKMTREMLGGEHQSPKPSAWPTKGNLVSQSTS